MKIYKINIKGKEYLYASERIFIAKGKTVQKNKSLGAVQSISNIALKKLDFQKYIIKEEINLRTNYWGKHTKDAKFLKYVSVKKLEELRTRLIRAKQNMGNIASSAMEIAFMTDFIYNSNKIEGSKMPRENVEKIVSERLKSKNKEVENTIKAINFINENFKFNAKQIEALHSILMAHEPSKLGYRKEKVVVGNQETTEWTKIKRELQELLVWYKKNVNIIYPPKLAFDFYYKFERIHPFVDGNGRIGRLLMNKILKAHRYHPMFIWNKKWQAHLSAFAKRMNDRGEYFYKFMADQYAKTYKIYIEKIEKAFNLEEQMNYFLKPSSYNLN